jgi:hypothetical protein
MALAVQPLDSLQAEARNVVNRTSGHIEVNRPCNHSNMCVWVLATADPVAGDTVRLSPEQEFAIGKKECITPLGDETRKALRRLHQRLSPWNTCGSVPSRAATAAKKGFTYTVKVPSDGGGKHQAAFRCDPTTAVAGLSGAPIFVHLEEAPAVCDGIVKDGCVKVRFTAAATLAIMAARNISSDAPVDKIWCVCLIVAAVPVPPTTNSPPAT